MNEGVFSGKSKNYEAYRMKYPMELKNIFMENDILPQDGLVADIGAGTGIFTEALIQFGYKVIAVEPNYDMYEVLRTNLEEKCEQIINASAENTQLKDKSISLITVATALHWFQPEQFKTECKRILTDNGKVMVVWNLTDKSDELIKDLHELNLNKCSNYAKLFEDGHGLDNSKFINVTEKIINVELQKKYNNDVCMDKDSFIGERLSCSYAPLPLDREYDLYVVALEDFFEQHQQNGLIKIPNFTECFIGTVK